MGNRWLYAMMVLGLIIPRGVSCLSKESLGENLTEGTMYEIDLIADYGCVTGEGPLWHPVEKKLYWTDIPKGRMFRYDPKRNQHECFYRGDIVGGFTIQSDGSLLLFMDKGAIGIWKEGELTPLFEHIPEESDSRFNDVIADPEGRVFCGTMSSKDHPGRLYRLSQEMELVKVLDGIGTSNGMGFNFNQNKMYYTDSRAKEIYIFDYDRGTGQLSNQQVFVKVPEGEGVPDGLTVDAEDHVWSARWDGGCIVRYSPSGDEVLRIEFPAKKVSSLTFGGDEYRDIYVTTAGGDNKEENGEGAGALFRVRGDFKGVPEFQSRVRIASTTQLSEQ